ncbi:MAG TPA: hypothetical protein VFA20_06740 [Myxococcaceae bacterium]|nr:hypothetical protein [Myxococcaceae bacterium]
MAVKVQGSAVPTVQTQQLQQDHQIVSPRDPASGLPTGKRVRDEFVHLPPDLGGVLQPKGKVSLSFGDRVNASGLSKALSSPINDLRLAFGKKTETITRDANGTYRGPEGQPLVPVKLDNGKTAYVDPNTNKYYLTDEQPDCHGRVHALPAQDLPKGSRFSNSYFGDADVKELTRIANGGSIINFPPPPPIKWPPVRPDPILMAGAAKTDLG